MSSWGQDKAQPGHGKRLRKGASVEKGTVAVSTQTHAGRSKSTTGAQQEHNRDATGKEIPPDLALVVDAWDHLPKPIKKAVLTLVKASLQSRSDR